MSDRTLGRHRAQAPVKTPLTTITTGVTRAFSGDLGPFGDNLGLLGRSGAALAVTSGLVASMALPAQAIPAASYGESVGAKSSVSQLGLSQGSVDRMGVEQSSLTLAAALISGAPIEAPAGAEVAFEHAAFRPAKVVQRVATVHASRSTVRSSTLRNAPGPVARADIPFGSLKGASVLAVAARYLGVRYSYGGSTPAGFDCSGYTKYVYGLLGVSLPRTAEQQMNASTIIPRSAAKAGDLVFVLNSRGVAYHVGIYAGGGRFYDAGSSGGHISLRAIFSSSIAFGRV